MFRSAIFAALALLSGVAHAVEVKPEINGTLDDGCLLDADENACAFMGSGSTRTGAVPSSIDNALLATATDTNYITMQDLDIQHSAGYGIRLGVNSDHIIVSNVDVSYAGKQTLGIRTNGTQTLITGSTFSYGALCHFKNRSQSDHNAPSNCKNSFPASVGLGGTNPHNAYSILHDSDVNGSYGEGPGSYGVSYTWSIGNRVRGTRSGPELKDNSSNNLVESGTYWAYDTVTTLTPLIGTNGFSGDPDWSATGVWATIEARRFCYDDDPAGGPCPAQNNVFRNNVVAASSRGGTAAKMNNRNGPSPPTSNPINLTEELDAAWYHNLFVGELDFANGTDEAYAKGELTFVNNIVMGADTGLCSAFGSSGYTTFNVDYNFWSDNPSDSDCDGGNDVTYGEVNIADNVDNWQEGDCPVSGALCFDQADFVLTNATTGDDAGTRLNNVAVSWLDHTEWDYFSNVTFPGGASPVGANWSQAAYYDFTGQARSNTPNIGPDETN